MSRGGGGLRGASLGFVATEVGHAQTAGPGASTSTFQPHPCVFRAVEISPQSLFFPETYLALF